jgi:hypothetical protein
MANRLLDSTRDRFIDALEDAGLDEHLANTVATSSNDLSRKIVRLIQGDAFETSAAHGRAAEIMGANFHGIDQVIQHLKTSPTKSQLRSLEAIPAPTELLEELKDQCILVPYFPVSIVELRERVGRELFYSLAPTWWYDTEKFANKRHSAGWHLIYKTEIPGSTDEEWEQKIPDHCAIPNSTVLAYAITLHRIVTGEALFPDIYVRCSDVDSRGIPVRLGHSSDGLGFVNRWGGRRGSVVGVPYERELG